MGGVAWWVWCGPSAWCGGVVGNALRLPGGGSAFGDPCAGLGMGGGEGCMGLTFYLAHFFPVKPQDV